MTTTAEIEPLLTLDEATRARLARRNGGRRRRGWLVRRALLAGDVLGISAAYALAGPLWPGGGLAFGPGGWAAGMLFLVATLAAWVVGAKLNGLYDRDEEWADYSTADELAGVFQLATLGSWLLFLGAWALDPEGPSFGGAITFWAASTLLVTAARSVARGLCRRTASYLQNTVIVGAGEVGQLVAHKLLQHPEYGLNLVGFVDSAPLDLEAEVKELSILGSPGQLPALVRPLNVERVIIAFSLDPREEILVLIRMLREQDVQVDFVPRFFECVGPRASLHFIEGMAVTALPPLRLPRSSKLVKRAFDLVVASSALVALVPLFLVVAVLIKLDSPGPVLFRQVRVGAGDRQFRIFKFRTMVADAERRKSELRHLNETGDDRLFKIRHDPRVTRVGRLLRRTSIDELPQLLNVLRGEMSLVGPRPLILEEDEQIAGWARRRLDLKPGMTGLWQVLGRSDIPFEEMQRLDYLYVTSWSLGGDLRLILRTIPTLFGRSQGAY